MTCSCLRGVSRWFTLLAYGPSSPESSKSCADVAKKLFTFTFAQGTYSMHWGLCMSFSHGSTRWIKRSDNVIAYVHCSRGTLREECVPFMDHIRTFLARAMICWHSVLKKAAGNPACVGCGKYATLVRSRLSEMSMSLWIRLCGHTYIRTGTLSRAHWWCRRGSGAGRKGHTKNGIRSTSSYRGVTHHCRTGRYEAHIWDSGKQVRCPAHQRA